MIVYKALVERASGKVVGHTQRVSNFYPALRPDGDQYISRYLYVSQFEQIISKRQIEFKSIDLFKGKRLDDGSFEGDDKEGLINADRRFSEEINFELQNRIQNDNPNESFENRKLINFASCWRLAKEPELDIWPNYRTNIHESVFITTQVNTVLDSIGCGQFTPLSPILNKELFDQIHSQADHQLIFDSIRNPFFCRKVRYYSQDEPVTEHFMWAAFHKRKKSMNGNVKFDFYFSTTGSH